MKVDCFNKITYNMNKENVNMDDRVFRMQHEMSNGGKVEILVECGVNGKMATEDEIHRVFSYAEDSVINVLKYGTLSGRVHDNDE